MNCHNSQIYLEEAIDSIYNQTYKNWEIIFWDNQSTDSSAQIAKSFDGRLKYFYSHEFSNLGTARNRALKKVNGKYIAFLDCDDLWYPEKIFKQVKLLEASKGELGFVYGKTEYYYEHKKQSNIRGGKYSLPEGMIFNKMLKNNFVPFVSAVVDKEKLLQIGGFPEDIYHSTDYYIFLKLAHRFKIKVLNEVCCMYRIHKDNLSNSINDIGIKECISMLSKYKTNNSHIERSIKFHKVRLAMNYFKNKRYRDSLPIVFSHYFFLCLLLMIFQHFQRKFGIY